MKFSLSFSPFILLFSTLLQSIFGQDLTAFDIFAGFSIKQNIDFIYDSYALKGRLYTCEENQLKNLKLISATPAKLKDICDKYKGWLISHECQEPAQICSQATATCQYCDYVVTIPIRFTTAKPKEITKSKSKAKSLKIGQLSKSSVWKSAEFLPKPVWKDDFGGKTRAKDWVKNSLLDTGRRKYGKSRNGSMVLESGSGSGTMVLESGSANGTIVLESGSGSSTIVPYETPVKDEPEEEETEEVEKSSFGKLFDIKLDGVSSTSQRGSEIEKNNTITTYSAQISTTLSPFTTSASTTSTTPSTTTATTTTTAAAAATTTSPTTTTTTHHPAVIIVRDDESQKSAENSETSDNSENSVTWTDVMVLLMLITMVMVMLAFGCAMLYHCCDYKRRRGGMA